ncbi:MAG: hypothetical protein IKX40_09090, partial [Thermoguttaceae bacterium]|nr:hypothetical protein [Thermoguttaceae bacterium]
MKNPILRLFSLVLVCCFVSLSFGQEAAPDQPTKIRVAMYADDGVGSNAYKNFPPIFESAPRFEMTKVTGQQIRDGILDNFDIFLLPGGMSSTEAESMQPEGVKKLKEFIKSGKGYLGFCAGAYFPIDQRFMDNAQMKTRLWQS